MSRKAVETTRNISNTSGAGSANQCTVQWWFQTSCKGNASLEAERSDWPLEADNYQLRAVIEVDPLTTTGEVAEELNADHSTVIQHLKQIGKVKKLDKWMPHCIKKKIVVLKCHLLFYTTTVNHLLIRL